MGKKPQREQKAKTGSRKKQGRRNSGGQEEISKCSNFLVAPFFLAFSALLSLWYLICNAEFDSNSSCSDQLSNFGIDSLQKLQNLPQNAISRIVGTLMCKSG